MVIFEAKYYIYFCDEIWCVMRYKELLISFNLWVVHTAVRSSVKIIEIFYTYIFHIILAVFLIAHVKLLIPQRTHQIKYPV